MIPTLLATLLVLANPCLQEAGSQEAQPQARAQEAPGARAISASQLSAEIDHSLHWLRGRFDTKTGSFGSLKDDAWALLAFVSSPRAYRPSDGPFVARPLERLLAARKTDSSFGGDQELLLVATTALATLSLSPEAFAGLEAPAGVSPTAAREQASVILAARNPDGSFGKDDGRLIETASRIEDLSSCHQSLRAHEKKTTRKARALPLFDPAQRAGVVQGLGRGTVFLLAQRIDGGWGFDGRRDAGITAMVTGALLAWPEPRPVEAQAAITEALDYLVALQREDGSIHEGQLANYVTSATVLALARGGREGDRAVIARATTFLKGLQADEGEGYSAGDRFYGGMGYGGDERPDLSNLQMALEALHSAGTPADDPAFKKALTFLQRCQNRSESNDLELVLDGRTFAAGNDGGAGYAPADSKAGYVDLPDGTRVPRSYGSMSYALLKGYLFAGLSKDDPRVRAVWQWLREHYTLDVNPGFEASDDPTAAYQGLFYYFYTMARALDLYDESSIVDAAGNAHDWRSELCGRLLAMQRQDGSWLNENAARWFEGNPVLATSYAMLTLGTALPAER